MGKRDQARLVNELREALLRAGFRPSRLTQLGEGSEARPVRSPGFTIQRHTDSKSGRLSHRAGRQPALEPGWEARRARGEAQMRLLVRYHAALESAGFVCVGVSSSDPMSPYSLWRRG